MTNEQLALFVDNMADQLLLSIRLAQMDKDGTVGAAEILIQLVQQWRGDARRLQMGRVSDPNVEIRSNP